MSSKNMLRRKMLRDVRKNFAQFITIFLMLTIGTMAYSGIRTYMSGMEKSAERYYAKNNLQDLDAFGKLNDHTVEKIKKIDHVRDVEGKFSILTKVANLKERDLQLNFIKSNNISKFHVVSGDGFDKNKSGIWLDEYFAKYNNLKVGDILEFDVNGTKLKQKIVGLIYVPDHVAYVKDNTEIFPVHDKYGFAYMSQNQLPEPMRFYSSVMIDVDEEGNQAGVKKNITDNMPEVASVLYTKDQYSAAGYQSEIDEGKTYVGIFSGLFIAIALLCVVTTMARTVRKDRMQIGVLKALGFTSRQIAWHYISYMLVIAVLGVIVGLLGGYFWFGKFFLDEEMRYFEVANYGTALDWDVWLVMGIIVFITCLTCYQTVRNYVRQPAAEILRVERPQVKSSGMRFTSSKFFSRMSFTVRWNIRDIIRNKIRVVTGMAGIAGCMALLVCGFSIKDTMHNYIKTELDTINNYRYRINISENAKADQIGKIKKDFSNNSSKMIAVETRKNGELKLNSVFVNDTNDAVRTLDKNWAPMKLPEDGVIITQKMALNEGYKIGEEIEWHVMGEKEYYKTKIVGMNRDPQNQNITMTRKFYESLGRKYVPDAIYTDTEIKNTPDGAATVQSIDAVRDGLHTMLATMNSMITILVVFAILLGIVIVYNVGTLSFIEKDYQFSTLKVLGFSDRKIANIFIQQNVWITIMAIIIGLPLGYAVTDFIFKVAIDESYDFAVFVTLRTCLISAVGTFLTSTIVSLWLTRRVAKIDMVKSLKGNE